MAKNKQKEVCLQFDIRYLFAGIGGIRRPYQKLGGTCVFSSEIDKFAVKTYEANWGETPSGDITKIAACEIKKIAEKFPEYKEFSDSCMENTGGRFLEVDEAFMKEANAEIDDEYTVYGRLL